MPDSANDTGTPPSALPAGPSLEGLRVRPVQPESTFQTVRRNLTPEIDTSRAALGPGHEFENDSPQAQGEAEYKASLGSALKQAYGHAKKVLETDSQTLTEKVIAPFTTASD